MDKIIESRFETLDALGAEFSDIAMVSQYWTSAKADSFAPPWKAIDLTQVESKILPRICVVDVSLNPLDFSYRFWGTGITYAHKRDATAQSVRSIKPTDFGALLFEQYEMVYRTKTQQTFVCEFENERKLVFRYVVRRFPLSNDGETVTGVISIEEYGRDKDDLSRLFESVTHPQRKG